MVDRILNSIADDLRLGDVTEVNDAIRNLVEAYNQMASLEGKTFVTEDSTGRELKLLIGGLDNAIKIKLINKYEEDRTKMINEAFKLEQPTTGEENTPIERIWGDTVLRRWIVKFVITATFGMLFLVVGATIALGYLTGVFTDGVFFTAVINTATEIIKLIFGAS